MRNRGLSLESGVTLQAELAAFAADQQHSIGTAMRTVTGDTAAAIARDLSRRVLIDKGPVLLDMACRASFGDRLDQIGSAWRAMRVMTIRALDRSFRNAMVYRQGELRLNCAVAAVAELRLRGLQQFVAKPSGLVRTGNDLEKLGLGRTEPALALVLCLLDKMRRMAGIAGNALSRVAGMNEALRHLVFEVAAHAAIGVFFSRAVETENQLIRLRRLFIVTLSRLLSLYMSSSGTVTGFA